MMADTSYLLVQVSIGDGEAARTIVRTLVAEKLAACAQILPIQSCYEWDGHVTEDDEFLMLIKTRADVYPALEARILALHSYDVPEILAIPIVAGVEGYMRWIDSVVAR